jgi:hypothetical protein
VTALLTVLSIEAAHALVMLNMNQIVLQFPSLQDQKLLTLSSCSFYGIVQSTSLAIDNCMNHYLDLLVVALAD